MTRSATARASQRRLVRIASPTWGTESGVGLVSQPLPQSWLEGRTPQHPDQRRRSRVVTGADERVDQAKTRQARVDGYAPKILDSLNMSDALDRRSIPNTPESPIVAEVLGSGPGGQPMLGDGGPLFRVVAEDEVCALGLFNPHAADCCKLACSIDAEWWEVLVDKASVEVAAVATKSKGFGLSTNSDRLVASGVTVGE